ncbi:DUF2147 domain-containing protein [Methylobacter luteus]|uniref:hypothetical protein n=1 Tax=Methylobacter luteus TaxID=415 RepID=UPI000428DBCB|nr:hypothetical protein [Methylobacter luteus]
MKNIIVMAVALFMLAASIISRAQAGDASNFVGLWETIDPDDGSHQVLSITHNGDGAFKLLIYDTYFNSCNGGRGLVQGTGKVSAEGTLKSDDFTITCFENEDTETASVIFSRNSDGTLTRTSTASFFPLKIYHQTSK